MSPSQDLKQVFDPNAAADPESGIFGLSFTPEEAALVIIPVPWDVTTSYRAGTAGAPEAVLEASHQVDLYDLDVEKPYTAGIAMLSPDSRPVAQIKREGRTARKFAEKIIATGGTPPKSKAARVAWEKALKQVNAASEKLNTMIAELTTTHLNQRKIVALLGGDHSVPFGAFQAMAVSEQGRKGYGILHIDAHSDTREAYEGFTHSHASIMNNALTQIPQIQHLVQVGIRDMCEEEMDFVRAQGKRVSFWSDLRFQRARRSQSWDSLVAEIIAPLPKNVWISFDIDGLDPKLCPSTGTPVPGGLEYFEATSLVRALVESGRTICGFDLNEVGPAEWDANIGARLLYKLCGFTLASQGKAKLLK